MAKVHYTLHVPAEARNVALAAHHYLTSGTVRGVHSATVQHGTPYDSLTVVGEETPELDSHIKQTGTFIGEVANAPVINVIKQGKNIAHWAMRNPYYQNNTPVGPPQPFAQPPQQPLGPLAMAPAAA